MVNFPSDIRGGDSVEIMGQVIAEGLTWANDMATAMLEKMRRGEVSPDAFNVWADDWSDLSADLRDMSDRLYSGDAFLNLARKRKDN